MHRHFLKEIYSKSKSPSKDSLIGVIHVSTSTVYFTIYTTPDYNVLCTASDEIEIQMPINGWFEQDAIEIMSSIYKCAAKAYDILLNKGGYKREHVLCISITNQRETVVMWNAITGLPLHKAILWNDTRTRDLVERFKRKLTSKKLESLKVLSGLCLSPYPSALKICWLQENVLAVHEAIQNGVCKIGTLDTWITWNLTKGSVHITDVTNASRTFLMNIESLKWDRVLLQIFKIDLKLLPEICSCSEIVARITETKFAFHEIFICGIIGDQQAALLGQSCSEADQTNCNYDIGCFLLHNTGSNRLHAMNGLITTIAYKMGPNARTVYALEGSIANGGRIFQWLTRKAHILANEDEAEICARSVDSAEGVYFVNALTGLYAPYWRQDARGLIIGLKKKHNAKHIVRAAHDAICYQIRDILECLRRDYGITVFKLFASGKLTENELLMQLQSDISGIPLIVSTRPDRTSLGAAFCAAHAFNFDLSAIVANKFQFGASFFHEYNCTKSFVQRELEYRQWQRAVKRALGWSKSEPDEPQRIPIWLLITLIPIFAVLTYYAFQYLQKNYDVFAKHAMIETNIKEPQKRFRRRICPYK